MSHQVGLVPPPFDLTLPAPFQGAQWVVSPPTGNIWPPNGAEAEPASGEQPRPVGSASPGLVVSSTSTKQTVRNDEFTRIRRLSRHVKVAAHHIDSTLQEGGFRVRRIFVTATYRPGEDWHPRDIHRLVDRYQQWGKQRGFSVPYVWVAELTQAGRVHYHLMLWIPIDVAFPPLPDKQGWWVKGMTNAQLSHSPVNYLAKYASKGNQGSHKFPKGLRMHGRGGLTATMRLRVTYALAPPWLKELVPSEHGVQRVTKQWIPFGRYGPAAERIAGGRWLGVKGWWRDLKTRMCFRTPYVGTFVPGSGVEVTTRPIERRVFVEPIT
jgi:hypothetical protein